MPYRRERGAVRPTRAQPRPSARDRESVMRKRLAAVLPVLVAGALIAGCTGESTATSPNSQPEQTQSEATATQDAPSTDTTSSTETPAQPAQPEESADLASVREEIASDGTMGAVWYLGMYDGDITSGDFSSWLSTLSYQDGTPLLTKYPFMANVTAKAVTEGSDIYCIVPAHAGDSVSVCQWLYSTTDDGQWSEKAGDTIYASDTDEPVLIQASAGEFNPNFAVSLHGTDGRSFDNHVLVTSGMDGKLVLPTDEQSGQALLSDFSPYAY